DSGKGSGGSGSILGEEDLKDVSNSLARNRDGSPTLPGEPFLHVDPITGPPEDDVEAQPTTTAPTSPSDCNPPDQPVADSPYPTPCRLQGIGSMTRFDSFGDQTKFCEPAWYQ
ncbi:hypothetical protein FOZ62_015083, partial [Perkinsus olseni]